MTRLIKQFRYYGLVNGNDNPKNYPEDTTYAALAAGNIFKNYNPVIQLGIQAPPGTKFYINNGMTPVMIGKTGIYELDLEGLGSIASIKFDRNSLNATSEQTPIMIDIVYEGASLL